MHVRTWPLSLYRCTTPSKIEWDLTNGPLRKLLELLDTQVFSGSVQWVLLEISWNNKKLKRKGREPTDSGVDGFEFHHGGAKTEMDGTIEMFFFHFVLHQNIKDDIPL